MLHLTKLTNRKFYNKWLYKITLKVPGCGIFRTRSLEEVKDFCLNGSANDWKYSLESKAWKERNTILHLACFLENFQSSAYHKRIEQDNIDLYTNDEKFYDDSSSTFVDHLIHRYEPDASTRDVLEKNDSFVSVKKLPHNKYRYRVYLLPHKLKNDKESKKKYVDWLKTQSPRIRCSTAVENWFIKTDWNWDRRYVLVEDEKTLLMMKLRNSEVVGRIYNFIVSDK